MRLLFWLSFALIGYAYVGYPAWLRLFGRTRSTLREPITPSVSIVIAARNEERTLSAKLENLRGIAYPQKLTQIVVVSDGSTDRTAQIITDNADAQTISPNTPIVSAVLLDRSQGKANALNRGVEHATGEILVFLDVRQFVDPGAVAALVRCFADPTVGAVSGELLLESSSGGAATNALGLYWKIEKAVRKLESASGSVIGVTGAIYAMRRELYVPIPVGTILDDVFVPMHVVRQGKRVIFEPEAVARDFVFTESGKEFARKVRTLTGNYQLVRTAPWLLSPANPVLFRFVSHKLTRLLVPFLLVVMLISSNLSSGSLYRALFWLQLLFYTVAAMGLRWPSAKRLRPVAVATTFIMLNAAAAIAFYNFVRGRNEIWVR